LSYQRLIAGARNTDLMKLARSKVDIQRRLTAIDTVNGYIRCWRVAEKDELPLDERKTH
jgi:hypothetical protein